MNRARNTVLLALLCLAASGAWAQVWRGPASIAIEVKGKPRGNVADALVILRYQQMEPPAGPRPVVTDSAGRAVVADLAEGVWEVEVSHDDFLSFVALVLLESGRKPVVQASFLQASGSSLTPIRVKFADGRGKTPSASVPLPPEAAERLAQRRPLAPQRPPAAATSETPSPRPIRPPEPVMPEPELRPLPEGAQPAESPVAPPPAEAQPQAEIEPPAAAAPEPLEPAAPSSPAEPPVETAPSEPEPVAPPQPELVSPEPAVPDRPEPARPMPEPATRPEPEPVPTGPEPATPSEREPAPPLPEPTAPPEPESAPAMPEPATPSEPEPAPSMPEPSTPPEPEPAPPLPEPTAPPEPEPSTPPAPAAVLPPPGLLGPTLRAYRDRTCIECRPGEFALSVETVVGPASGACSEALDAAGRELATLLGSSVALELEELAAPAAQAMAQMGASDPSARVAELLGADADACRLVAAVIPKAGRFRGLRMEAADATGVGDCRADRPCPVGRAYWIGQPRVARQPSANVIWGIFVNEAPDRARRARLTVYFAAPYRAWDPPR